MSLRHNPAHIHISAAIKLLGTINGYRDLPILTAALQRHAGRCHKKVVRLRTCCWVVTEIQRRSGHPPVSTAGWDAKDASRDANRDANAGVLGPSTAEYASYRPNRPNESPREML